MSGLTGVITYAYFLIASHTLSKPDYGQITVLWSAVFITISTLYRPIEQLLCRHISERDGQRANRSASRCGSPRRSSSASRCSSPCVALALRGPIQNDLLEGNETLYWVFFTSVLFYAASYFARGFLAGNQQFGLFVALILTNPASARSSPCWSRSASSAASRLGRDRDHRGAGARRLLVVPFAFARRAQKEKATAPPPAAEATGAERRGLLASRHGGGFAAAVLLIMFSEQAFLNAGPLIIRGLQGAAEAGYIFNVLMLARAPLQLFQSISTSILPHLTSLHATEDRTATTNSATP